MVFLPGVGLLSFCWSCLTLSARALGAGDTVGLESEGVRSPEIVQAG
jgi:hypothetical protein